MFIPGGSSMSYKTIEALLLVTKKYATPLLFIMVFASIVFSTGGCASTGYPGGGPRDEVPPVMLRSIPPEGSLSFIGEEIRIEFDEIIQVRDIFQKLMVSPPVNELPEVTARGRSLVVRFKEDLQPNTTYTLDFADAISDNNEGNVLQDFRFSFSTGEIIDSLRISGFLFDAQTLAPVGNALVMVHKNHADSAFKTLVPIRVTKSNPDGRFSIQNLSPGEYRLYALEDVNRNFRYDQPGERIAWNSQLVSPFVGFHERIDSIPPDSIVVVKEQAFLPDSIQLFLFQEDNVEQYLRDVERKSRNRIDFFFSRPVKENLDITLVDRDMSNWFVYERSARHDSISLWLTDSVLIKSDSLFLRVRYHVPDSAANLILKTDTLNAYFFQVGGGETRSRRRGDEDKEKEIPVLRPEGLKGTLEILEDLTIRFPSPVNNINYTAIRLSELVDTLFQPIDVRLTRDSIRHRRYVFEFDRVPGNRYLLEVDSAAFTDIYGLSTNAIRQEFTVKTEESYGIFYIDVAKPEPIWLLQILDRQEKVVRQASIPANGKIAFQYLLPGDYYLRIVVDENRNGQWDTGDFLKGIQPEGLVYFPEIVNIRANWSRIIPWNPHEFNIHDFVKTNRQRQGAQRR